MPDIDRLLSALVEYQRALAEERRRVSEAHRVLTDRFRALSAVYEGTAAREFKAGWSDTQDAFDTWVDAQPALLALLDEKIEQLRRLDQAR